MNATFIILALTIAVLLIVFLLILQAERRIRKAQLHDSRRIANIAVFGLSVFQNETSGYWGVLRKGVFVAQDPDLRIAIDTAIVELHRIEATA